ncbi:MAG: glycosyltransferase, partial [Chloroflexota bacterium]
NPVDSQGLAEVQAQQWRLFRNIEGVRFEGRIHEQLLWPGGNPRIRAAQDHDITLRHRGYIDEGELLRRKGERNRRLLEMSLAEEPQQPAHYFFLGRQHAWERRFDLALPVLRRAMELWAAGPQVAEGYVPSMFSTAALAALRESQPATVLEIEAATPKQFVSAELLFAAGVGCAGLGRTQEAIERLNRAWQDPSLATATGNDPSASSWRPLLALAEIHEAQGRTDEARSTIEQALEFAPHRQDLQDFSARLRRPLVSACMIVRNEEQNLQRWLPLVREAVDELIVVDTGSEDASARVAAELGAQVHHFAWCDDFAAARNESLRHATGRWVLWIDADDEPIQASPNSLRQLCRSLPESVHGCWLGVQSPTTEAGAPGASLRQWRLFRNGLGLRFRGRVHEQLSAPPEAGALSLVEQDRVQVRHWGYASSPETMQRKGARNRQLLELSIASEPNEP